MKWMKSVFDKEIVGLKLRTISVFIIILAVFYMTYSVYETASSVIDDANRPYFNAAKEGDIKSVKELLKKGAKVNEKDRNGATALRLAAENGHIDMVKLLVSNGADVNVRNSQDLIDGHLYSINKYLIIDESWRK